jgi:hypothetical protein
MWNHLLTDWNICPVQDLKEACVLLNLDRTTASSLAAILECSAEESQVNVP